MVNSLCGTLNLGTDLLSLPGVMTGQVVFTGTHAMNQSFKPSHEYVVDGFISVAIRRAFDNKSEDFKTRLEALILLKPFEERTDTALNIFSKETIASFDGLDEEELLNYIALTL